MSDNMLCYDICDSSSRGEIVPEVRLLGPKGSQHPRMAQHGSVNAPEWLDAVGRHPIMAAWVGRHPRMAVPGRSSAPELPGSMYVM